MTAANRAIVTALVRLLLLAIAVWFVVAPSALGPDVPAISRFALAVLATVFSVVLGEVAQMRQHLGITIGAIRQMASGKAGPLPEGLPETPSTAASEDLDPDDDRPPLEQPAVRRAIPILIDALDGTDAAAQAAARVHLTRLTGEDHGKDAATWRAWWTRQEEGAGEQDA